MLETSQIRLELQLPRTTDDQGGTTVADLRKRIIKLYPEILVRRIPMGIAVNGKMANEKSLIYDLDEIALLPPVSGG